MRVGEGVWDGRKRERVRDRDEIAREEVCVINKILSLV